MSALRVTSMTFLYTYQVFVAFSFVSALTLLLGSFDR